MQQTGALLKLHGVTLSLFCIINAIHKHHVGKVGKLLHTGPVQLSLNIRFTTTESNIYCQYDKHTDTALLPLREQEVELIKTFCMLYYCSSDHVNISHVDM